MKTENLIYALGGLILGLVLSYFLICKPDHDSSSDFTINDCCEKFKDSIICTNEGIGIVNTKLGIDSARAYFMRYVNVGGAGTNAVGYTIPTNVLLQAYQSATNNSYPAVRFYPGIDHKNNKIGMFIGLELTDNEFKEDSKHIYQLVYSSDTNSMVGPCPRWCQMTKREISQN
ncbi:MAG: hypothetical protein IPM48_01160 [Saprospiraceae bacterium]|nr:hypothetical protein [Saprospiraceae bacterium]